VANKRASFEELYRANQKRAEEEQQQPGRKPGDTGSGTLMLSEPVETEHFYLGGDLGLPDEAPPDLGSFGTLFQKKKTDLGGLADPNQSAGANPYDTQAGSRPRAIARKPAKGKS
jgi:hypothetical protein